MKKIRDMTEPELGQFMLLAAKGVEVSAEMLSVEKPLFTLLVWNDQEVGQYVSNANRADTIKALRETADRLEARMDVVRSSDEN